MAGNNCSTCNQSFNSERELREHQQSEHSGNLSGGHQPAFSDRPSTGDQAGGQGEERDEKNDKRRIA